MSREEISILCPRMLLLAVTALEKLSKIPPMFWVKVVVAIVLFLVGVVVLRKLLEVNKVLLIAVGSVTFCMLWFQWIYERNEPAFLTPVIEPIAQFFPSKGSYGAKQQSEPDKPGLKKSSAPAAAKH